MRLREVGREPFPGRWFAGTLSMVLVAIILFYPIFSSFESSSLASWTWAACNSLNDFVHGRLVPLVFPWMVWAVWRRRQNDLVRPSYWGLVLLLPGLLLFLVAMRIEQPRIALVGLPFVVLGLVLFWFGTRIARAMILPAFFLLFMVPVPGLVALISGILTVEMMKATYHVGNFFGMDLTMTGSSIWMSSGEFRIAEG